MVNYPRTLKIKDKKKIFSVISSLMICIAVFFGFRHYIPPKPTGVREKNFSDHQSNPREESEGEITPNTNISKRELNIQSSSQERVSITNFRPEDFDKIWSETMQSGTTEMNRLNNLSIVIGRMSQFGDAGLIFEKIKGQFGPGKSRCYLLGQVFMTFDPNDSLSKVYSRLEFPDELTAAQTGISQSLCMMDSPEAIDRAKYTFLGDQLDNVIRKSLEYYVSRFRSQPEQLSLAVSKTVAMQSSDEQKRSFLLSLVRIAPFDCWDQLTLNGMKISDTEQELLLSKMIQREPIKAINQIASATGKEKCFSSAFKSWLESDARTPIEWLENNKQNLNSAQIGSAIQGIAEYTAQKGDSETAWKWVDQITDPQLRKVAEGHVWSMERDSLRQEVGKDPAGTMQSIVSGQSKYGDYWIEEAMGTWVAKDFDQAQNWYQQNWNTMPAAKSQYVAAAFANQAVQQGDVATARQWAAYIQDAKTKQRIDASIAKAEPQKGN